MQAAGVETFIMNIYRNIDRNKVQFDFLVHYKKHCFFDDEIEQLGGKIYRFPVRENFNVFKYMIDLNTFFKMHPEYKVIHGHMPSFGILYFTIAKLNGVKIRISHSHTSSAERSIKGFVKRIPEKMTKYCANMYFACSNTAGKYLFGKKSFKIIQNAIDVRKFIYNSNIRDRIRSEMGIDKKFVIGHIGRLSKQKNHEFLIDIFSEIHKKNKNAILMLVGSGELLPQIEDKVKKLGLQDNVLFLGIRNDVNELYQAMDVFVLPSFSEGLPVVGVETQAAGLRCFFSDSVTDEVKITYLAQFISLQKSSDYWANLILECDDGYSRKNMTTDIIGAGYDIRNVAKKLENYYLNQ